MLPVGGIKEKVLAAKRAGVHDVILPAENKTNVDEDLTLERLGGLTPHYVKTIDEVLEIALPTTAKRSGRTPRFGESAERAGRLEQWIVVSFPLGHGFGRAGLFRPFQRVYFAPSKTGAGTSSSGIELVGFQLQLGRIFRLEFSSLASLPSR